MGFLSDGDACHKVPLQEIKTLRGSAVSDCVDQESGFSKPQGHLSGFDSMTRFILQVCEAHEEDESDGQIRSGCCPRIWRPGECESEQPAELGRYLRAGAHIPHQRSPALPPPPLPLLLLMPKLSVIHRDLMM